MNALQRRYSQVEFGDAPKTPGWNDYLKRVLASCDVDG